MAVTHTLQANFTQSLGKAIVPPAGSKTMVFFGTAGDGNEANRIAGGPALTVSSGAPVHSSNYVSLGTQPAASPTRNDVIDAGIPNDSTNFAAGFTWAAVARVPVANSVFAQVVGNQTSTTGQGQNAQGLTIQQNVNRVILYQSGNRANIQLVNPVLTAWHFIAYTNNGGAAPSLNIYEFTENQAGQVANYVGASGLTSIPAMSTHFGMYASPGESSTQQGPVDVAWGFACAGAMSQANLAALAASVRPWLLRRGIVM
jgi:hypothetical protein